MSSTTKLDLKGAASVVTQIKKAATPDRDGVISSNVAGVEDEFTQFYTGPVGGSAQVLQPPYNMRRLRELTDENNTLGPCIDAMEINIDSTGFVVEHSSQDSTKSSDLKVKKLGAFFDEVYPLVTFRMVRKQMRRDQEATGNAYLEVIRNPAGEIVFVRRVDPVLIRLCRLGEAIPTQKKVTRGGKTTTVTMMSRERRFVQIIGANLTYFKEYGSSRDLDKITGVYSEVGKKLPASQRATEILHFTCHLDVNTPYGVPRWIAQSPSVMGSRKSEVFNLDFFDNGGIPPVMIFVTGGMMDKDVRKRLEQVMAGGAKTKNRGAVVEVHPTGSDINSSGSAGVKVERFGAERQQDAMFEKYDLRCEEKIRCSFRLPPLFIGKASDYTYATAYASYVIAEAQVFRPEREEFDEVMNITIMRELDPSGEYKFRSLPMSVKDVELQLKALGVAKDFMDGADVISAINEMTSTSWKYTEPPEPVAPEFKTPPVGSDGTPLSTDNQNLTTADGGSDSNNPGQKRPPVSTDTLRPQQTLKPNSSGK